MNIITFNHYFIIWFVICHGPAAILLHLIKHSSIKT